MINIFRKEETRKIEIPANALIEHLGTLQETEDKIHVYNKHSDLNNLINTSKEREILSKTLSAEFQILEKDIKKLTNGEGPGNKRSFNTRGQIQC